MMKRYPPLELTASQSEILTAIFDTFLAPLTSDEEQHIKQVIQGKESIYQTNTNQVSKIAGLSASSLNVQATVLEFFENHVEPAKRVDLIRVLDLLGTRPGSLLLTRSWTPFSQLGRFKREQILLKWKLSSIQQLNALYNAFAGLCFFNAYSRTGSPLAQAIGYDAADGDRFFENHPDYKPVMHDRIPMMSTEEATSGNLKFDVIVVGSGAGGGVVAAELSQAGYSVLVIEKGKYYHQSEIVQEEEKGFANMYDGGTSSVSTNGQIQCLSGSTLGGGTTLNYLVSLKPQHFVREEWAKKCGLSHFMSPQFDKDLNRVFERIGASTENVLHTKTHEKFVGGCNKLGYHIEAVPVNTGGRAHHCNKCIMGCKAGIKNSTTNTWLLDAMKNGARFLDKTLIARVLIEGKKAIGVVCRVHDAQDLTIIKAKRVVVACGSLRTPSVLKASGLANPHIGRHLKLQPICFNFGFYDVAINQNEGPLISSVCNASDNCQGDYYGAKIEEGCLLPGGLSSKLPWLGAAKHKELMLRHKSMVSLLNVIRDKDSIGIVDAGDPNSPHPVYEYALSKHDEKSMTIGIERNMKVLVASGARELYSCQAHVEPFVFEKDEESRTDNPRFIKWIETIRKAGISRVSTPLISVHQLGSCQMGISPKIAPVQPSGETFEVKNLYVADGSLFPTSVGVNPMVTIEAIALHVARHISTSLSKQERTSRL